MENDKGIQGRRVYQEAIAFMSSQTHYYIETWNGCVKVNTMSLKDEPVEGGYGFDMNIKNYDKSNIYFEGDDIIYNKSNPKKSCNYIDYGVGVYDYSHFKDTSISFDLSLIQEKYSNCSGFCVRHKRYCPTVRIFVLFE